MIKKLSILVLLVISGMKGITAQPVFTDVFPPEEYAARRLKVMEKIGDGVAVILGTTERPGEQPLRQANQFHYLCGVVEPRAILLIDGRTRRTTLFLSAGAERRATMFGSAMMPGEAAAKAVGVDQVLKREEFAGIAAKLAGEGRTFYAPFRPEVLGNASSSDVVSFAAQMKSDPWDGRQARESIFIEKLKGLGTQVEVRDLDPILDYMRAFKSPREIKLLREATAITCEAILEGMRYTRPGMFEYELQAPAEYVFKRYGSQGAAYFALIATGENTLYSHYHKNTAVVKDGDLIQYDYAPDYKYYVSDVTRVYPANGRFTAWQREYYLIYLRLYQALMTSIQVHKAPREIVREAVVKMDRIMADYKFTDERIRKAAQTFVDRYRSFRGNSLGHSVGMEVHDVRLPGETLEPGQVFTIEPAMIIPELHYGIRLEDMILITEQGYENLSGSLPVEPAAIERAMKEPGEIRKNARKLF